jgi:bacillithiol biosynthesis cysteine-adding enzyme BshC
MQFGAGDVTLQNIRALENGGLVVMGGQQPGLLTGPIFTIYKVIATIKYAEQLSNKYNRRFIPFFWNASETDKWSEVNHIYVIDETSVLRRIELTTLKKCVSLGKIPLKEIEVEDVVEQFDSSSMDTEFKSEILKLIRETSSTAQTFSQWFSALLLRLFDEEGLVLVDPSQLELKEAMREVFESELEDPLSTTHIVNEAWEKMKEVGYRGGIRKSSDACSFFLEEGECRASLTYSSGNFETHANRYTKAELLKILHRSPQRFTTGAALRPIASSFLFPVALHLVGPRELAYMRQLDGVFEKYKLKMPPLALRPTITLVENNIGGVLSKYKISPSSLFFEGDGVINKLIRDEASYDSKVEEVKEAIFSSIDTLEEWIEELDPTLVPALHRMKGKVNDELRRLSAKLLRYFKKRESILVSQIQKARRFLYPNDSPQDRVLNIMYFLNKYGWDLLKSLLSYIPLDYKKHHYLQVEVK